MKDTIKEVRLYDDWYDHLYIVVVYSDGKKKTFAGVESLPPASWTRDAFEILEKPDEWFEASTLTPDPPDMVRRWLLPIAKAKVVQPGNIHYSFNSRAACESAYKYVLGITKREK